jgi:hypothetical protein
MATWVWHDDWKIPVIAREVPTRKEVEVGVYKIHAGDNVAPKKMNHNQKSCNRRRGVRKISMCRKGKRTLPQHKQNKEWGTKEHKKPPRQPPHKKQGHPSGQSYTQEGRTRRIRCINNSHSIKSLRMISNSS